MRRQDGDRPRVECGLCGGDDITVFASIEAVPVHCNVLHRTREAALSAPTADIRLGYCRACGFIQNTAFEPGLVPYTVEYENALHHSAHFREYARGLAADLIRSHGLTGRSIVEIGCGDGYFLRLLCREGGNQGWGFDPSDRGASAVEMADDSVRVIPDYFRPESIPGQVDFVCCRHVLEHVPRPRELAREIRRACGWGHPAVVFVEVPNGLSIVHESGIWDILYEHCSYFSAATLSRLFGTEGFRVLRTASAYSGQFLQLEAVAADPSDNQADPASGQTQPIPEEVECLGRLRRAIVASWDRKLGDAGERGRRMAIWGAGTKGVMFLNSLREANRIGCAVDLNPKKQGTYIAGTGHEIVAPESLATWKPDLILVMNHSYLKEIAAILDQVGLNAELVPVCRPDGSAAASTSLN